MNLSQPVALLDLSSYIFYRFFAIQKWLSISGRDKDFTPEMVIDKFSSLFESNLKDIKKKLKIDWKNIILVRDCPRDKIWRLEVFPDYKKSRDEKRSPLFDPTVFTKAYTEIVPRMIKEYGLNLVHYDRAEADDVIAIMHNEIRRQHPLTKIFILSADTDFVQLHSDITQIINFQFKSLAATVKPKEALPYYALWKVIRGDSSDNIPAIDKKIGDATALKLATNRDLLKAKLDASAQVNEAFLRNRTLIDFNYIPDTIRVGVIDLLKKL